MIEKKRETVEAYLFPILMSFFKKRKKLKQNITKPVRLVNYIQ